MADDTISTDGPPLDAGIALIDIEQELRRSYLGYAVSTLVSRALPDIRDGFKPVQRRILHSMREAGITPASARVKCAKVVGDCFTAGTLVSTPQGHIPIEALNVGDLVYTQNAARRVTQAYIMPPQPLLEIEMADGVKVTCTKGQQFKVLTEDLTFAWKDAAALAENDFILSRFVDSAAIGTSRQIPYLGAKLMQEFREKHLGGGWYVGANGEKVRSGLRYANGTKIRYAADVAETFEVYFSTLLRIGLLQKMEAIGSAYLQTVQQFMEYGLSFRAVKAICEVAPQVTYDIQVETDHEFIANGLLVHNCMGNYHPHGDAAIYGTLVRMAQDFSMRYPLIDPQGNFGCFTGDTKIKLLDGTVKTFAELAELSTDEAFYVYSVNKAGEIVVGEGRNSRVTRRGAKLVRVTLDNGATVRCTPDHRFMLRDGTYREAQFLTTADSLMPGYFDHAPVKTGTNDYLRVYQPQTGQYAFVHHIADIHNAEHGIAPDFHGAFVRHHKNFNRFDNRPINIERMKFAAHLRLHQAHIKTLWNDASFRAAQRTGVLRYYAQNPAALEARRARFVLQNQNAAFRSANGKRVGAALKRRYASDLAACAAMAERMKTIWADPAYRARMSMALRGVSKRPLTSEQKQRVAQILSEKSRAMWADPCCRARIAKAHTAAMQSSAVRARVSAGVQTLWRKPEYRAKYGEAHFSQMAQALWSDSSMREMHRTKILRQYEDAEFCAAHAAGVRRSLARRMEQNPQMMRDMAAKSAVVLTQKWQDVEYKNNIVRQKVARYVSTLLRETGEFTPEAYEAKRNENWIPRYEKAFTYFGSVEAMREAGQNYNHRIISVEWLEETADVYDITVDVHHNFLLDCGVFVHNSVDGDPPAAYRYTECRLTPIAMEMMEDIDRDTIDFRDNYDQTRREPSVFPGKFPEFLCNGGEGIAVGMSSSVPPHNLREVVDATIYALDHPEATSDDLSKFIPGPDFPTSGVILGTKGAKEAYRTGRGRVIMQAQMQIEPMDNGKNAIVVTELPYQVNKAKLIIAIAELVKQKKVDGITAVDDFSDKHGMRMVIELRRDARPKQIVNYLLKHTSLRQTFGIIMLALVNGQPRILTLAQVIGHFLAHRKDIVIRRTRFDLARVKREAHINEGLQIALNFLDEIIALIRKSASGDAARIEMARRYGLTGLQAEAILNMQLRRIAQLESQRIEDDYKNQLKQIAQLEDILQTPARVAKIVREELKYLKDKYGDDRKTKILPQEADEITEEDLITEEETIVTISRDGYVKRVPMDTYRTQKRGGRGVQAANLKEEDQIAHLFTATTTHYILFFTDRGRVYRLKAYEVPETSRQARGQHINNFIQVEPGDKITAILPMPDLKAEGFLLMATENGEVKRSSLSDFANLRANGLICFNIEEGDSLKWVRHTTGDQEIILVTQKGMSLRCREVDVPDRGRTAGGVRGIEMRDPKTKLLTDKLVGVDVVSATSQLLVVSEKGYGKRTDLSRYTAQKRGGRGLITMNVTNKTGPIVDAAVVEPDDKLMVITERGVTIRMDIATIRETGRSAQGVTLINLDTADSVTTITRLIETDDLEAQANAIAEAKEAEVKERAAKR